MTNLLEYASGGLGGASTTPRMGLIGEINPGAPAPSGTVTPEFSADVPPALPPVNGLWGTHVPVSFGHRVISGVPVWLQGFVDALKTPDPSVVVVPEEDYAGYTWARDKALPGGGFAWEAGNAYRARAAAASTEVTPPIEQTIANFAVAFGKPLSPDVAVTDLYRLWADNVLIYDHSQPVTANKLEGLRFTFHSASEDAVPDALIQAAEGDMCPAFRGLIYIVFNRFPLYKLGLGPKLPTIRAELVDRSNRDDTITELNGTDVGEDFADDGFFADWADERAWWWQHPFDGPNAALVEIDLATNTRTRVIPINDTADGGVALAHIRRDEFAVYDPDNRVVHMSTSAATGVTDPIVMIDIGSGDVLHRINAANDFYENPAFAGCLLKGKRPGGQEHWGLAVRGTNGTTFAFYDATGGYRDHKFYDDAFGGPTSGSMYCYYPLVDRPDLDAISALNRTDDSEQAWCALQSRGGSIYRHMGEYNSRFAPSVFFDMSGFTIEWITYDPLDGNIIVIVNDAGTRYAKKIKVVYSASGHGTVPRGSSVLWTSPALSTVPATWSNSQFVYSRLDGGSMAFHSGGDWQIIDTQTGMEIYSSTSLGGTSTFGYIYDSLAFRAVGSSGNVTMNEVQFDRGALGSVLLSEALTWMALDAGFAEDDINIDGIDDVVIGGLLDSAVAFGNVISNLSKVYDFLYYEIDGKINFRRVGRGSDLAVDHLLTVDDMGNVEGGEGGGGVLLPTTMPTFDQIPAGVEIRYLDWDFDMAQNSQQFRRSNFPIVTTLSSQIAQYDVPIIMTGADVRKRCAQLAFRDYTAAISHELRLSQYFADITPGMVLQVNFPARNRSYIIQTVEVTWNGDWSFSVGGTNYSMSDEVDVDLSEEQSGILTSPSPAGNPSLPYAFDIPLLSGRDEPAAADAQTIIYIGVGPKTKQDDWQSAQLHASVGRDAYGLVYTGTQPVLHGRMLTTLPDTDVPFSEDSSEYEIGGLSLTDDFMQSVATDEEFTSGLNSALVGSEGRWELIYFRTVEVLSERHFRISGIARGRRGTETLVGTHQGGDRFVLMSSPLKRVAVATARADISDIGVRYDHKALGAGQNVMSAAITWNLAANALKPWSPVSYAAEASGSDVTLSWLRRDRVGLDSTDDWLTDPEPMSEESEEYEVEITNGSGTVIRTYVGLSSPSATYTDAHQTADGFTSPVTTVSFRVYQISAAVGRGFTHEETVDVG
jgi:hypothetical protein